MADGWRLWAAIGLVSGTAISYPATADPTLVKIDSGVVHGVGTGDVISFKGIPYAEPPIGALRWRAPQPVKAWQGVYEAAQFGPSCMQADDVPTSEDCLTLTAMCGAQPPLRVRRFR